MITFVTLLLGLVLGPQEVAVAVDSSVAEVAFLLDGEPQVRVQGPPWKAELDLGSGLLPHRLEAVAYDASGTEVGRTEQLLNLPRPASEITLTMRLDPDGKTSSFDINWSTVLGLAPQRFDIFFDGQRLVSERLRGIPLPPYNPRQLHLLQVELEFSQSQVAATEVTFGGVFAEAVSSDLTAVALRRVQNRSARFRAGGPLGVLVDGRERTPVAVEPGRGEFIVVRALEARAELERVVGPRGRRGVYVELGKDEILRLVGTIPQLRKGPLGDSYLFPTSEELPARDGLLGPYLAHVGWQEQVGTDLEAQRLVEALAISGLTAVELNRRRVVVVILGPPPKKPYRGIAMVRNYLRALGVPMVAWSTDAASWETVDHEWGEIADISRPIRLQRAVRRARRELEAQTVAWFEGSFLPQDFAARPGAGVEIAR